MNHVRSLGIVAMSCCLFALSAKAQELRPEQQILINKHAEAVTEAIINPSPGGDDDSKLCSCDGGGRCMAGDTDMARRSCENCAKNWPCSKDKGYVVECQPTEWVSECTCKCVPGKKKPAPKE